MKINYIIFLALILYAAGCSKEKSTEGLTVFEGISFITNSEIVGIRTEALHMKDPLIFTIQLGTKGREYAEINHDNTYLMYKDGYRETNFWFRSMDNDVFHRILPNSMIREGFFNGKGITNMTVMQIHSGEVLINLKGTNHLLHVFFPSDRLHEIESFRIIENEDIIFYPADLKGKLLNKYNESLKK